MGDDNSDKKRNISCAIFMLTDRVGSRKSLSLNIGVNISTINRWISGDVLPRNSSLISLSKACGIKEAQFNTPHHDFVKLLDGLQHPDIPAHKHIERRVELRSIEKWKHLWDEAAQKYAGSYHFYNRVLLEGRSEVARSLLLIGDKSSSGIDFEIHNIDTRTKSDPTPSTHYKYSGFMFPVFDSLLFIGEEESSDEVISILTTSSQKSPPAMISGYFTAIGVDTSKRTPNGSKVLLQFISSRRVDINAQMSKLGVFNEREISSTILDKI